MSKINRETVATKSEQALETITSAILEGRVQEAKNMIEETCRYEKMVGVSILSPLTIRDLQQAIVEAELKQSCNN